MPRALAARHGRTACRHRHCAAWGLTHSEYDTSDAAPCGNVRCSSPLNGGAVLRAARHTQAPRERREPSSHASTHCTHCTAHTLLSLICEERGYRRLDHSKAPQTLSLLPPTSQSLRRTRHAHTCPSCFMGRDTLLFAAEVTLFHSSALTRSSAPSLSSSLASAIRAQSSSNGKVEAG